VSLNIHNKITFKLLLMLKNILKIEGVQKLGKSQQVTIIGGIRLECDSNNDCFGGRVCSAGGHCITPQCTSNADCAPGDFCQNYYCYHC
jgi:Cys-rich repeat protein